jgi:hypothetical protein
VTDDKRPAQVDRMLGEVFEAEGRTRAPDRLLEEVFVRTRDTRQARRGPLGGVRLPAFPGRITPLAVAAVLVIGSLVAIGGVGSRVLPVATPAPAQQADRTPAASPAIVLCRNGTGLSGTVPALWAGCATGIRAVDVGSPPPVTGASYPDVGVPVIGPAGMWAITASSITEIDPTAGPGRTLDVPGIEVLGVGTSALWGGTGDDTVVRIDPATGTITGTIRLGAQPLAIVEAGGRVWVTAGDSLVHSYDAVTLAAGPTAEVGSDAARIGANASAVYVVSQGVEGTVTRIDLASGEVASVVVADPGDPRSLGELLVGDDGVWVTRRTGIVSLDPTTLATRGRSALPGYPIGLVRDGRYAWVFSDGRLDLAPLP